jgi:integrase
MIKTKGHSYSSGTTEHQVLDHSSQLEGSEPVVKRKLRPLLESLGIQRGGLHAFRHFSATMMDRLNAPLELRQQRLGHSDAELTLGV